MNDTNFKTMLDVCFLSDAIGCLYGDLWGNEWMCLYDEWCGCKYLRPLTIFGTSVGLFNIITIWHVSGRTCLWSSFEWQTKALILEARYDCFATCSERRLATCPENTTRSILSFKCWSTYVPHTIVKMRHTHVRGTVVSMSRKYLCKVTARRIGSHCWSLCTVGNT